MSFTHYLMRSNYKRNPNPWSESHLLQKSYVEINCFHTYHIQQHICCPFDEQNAFYDISKTLQSFITLNFASHNLVMEIIWNLFFIGLQFLHTNVMRLKHVWIWWMIFIHFHVGWIFKILFICVSNMFYLQNMCVKKIWTYQK